MVQYNSMRITLNKYKDDTYYWNLMQDELPVSYNVMLSKGLWLYNIPLQEIIYAVERMREKNNDIAVFDDKRYVCTRSTKEL